MICDIFLPIMPAIFAHWERSTILSKSYAYIAHWRKKCNLVQILRIYCALEKEVQSCANFAHILRIGEYYNLAQNLHTYSALGKEVQSCANLAHILRIGRESCANLAHILRTDTSNAQLAHLAQNTISQVHSNCKSVRNYYSS